MPTRKPSVSRKPNPLRARAERLLRRPGKASKAARTVEDSKRLIHELRVHQIELEMQNDELRRAQVAAEEARAKYADLYEIAPTGYLLLDGRGAIKEANVAATVLLNLPRRAIAGRLFMLFLEPASRPVFRQFLLGLLKTDRSGTCEVLLENKKKARVALLLKGITFSDARHRGSIRLAMSDITERKQAEEQLQQAHGQLRELALRLQQAREEECTRIAREIHDVLGQALTLQKLDLAGLLQELANASPSLQDRVQGLSGLTDTMIATVQDLAIRLRPMVLDRFGLLPAIQWWAREFEARTSIPCRIELLSEWAELDRDRSLVVFRIFQEVLTNVARHAKASRVTVTVGERQGRFVCEMRDNGRGITQAELSDPASFGVIDIQQRVALLQGEATIVGAPGEGTTVTVTLPISAGGPGGGSLVFHRPAKRPDNNPDRSF